MYDERPYGDILRNEREMQGYDLETMSRRLHIRPDILRSIEQSDFDRMPARGYSKNMVRAYARALHLNEQAITDMFLDQSKIHDMNMDGLPSRPARLSRQRERSSQSIDRASSGRRRNYGNDYSSSRSMSRDLPMRSNDIRRQDRSRANYGDRWDRAQSRDLPKRQPRRSADDMGAQRTNRSSRGSLGMGFLSSIGGRGSARDTKIGRSPEPIGSTPPYARGTANNGPSALAGMNLPLLLVIVAVVIALVIIVVIVTNGSQKAVQEVPDIPISGLTDTSGISSSSDAGSSDSATTGNSVALPESVEVVYEVKEGQRCWMEVYENGSSDPLLAEVVTGPNSRAFDVTKSIRILTANPDGLTVTVDGKKVDLKKGEGDNYEYSLTFSDWLDQWKKDNDVEDSSSRSSSARSSSSSASSE